MMTRAEALELLNGTETDKVAELLAMDPGTMIDVMMKLNPGCGIVDIAKWYERVTKEES